MRTLILAALAMLATTVSALAQQACAPHAALAHALTSEYGEARLGYGLSAGVMVEIWANPETATWTILTVRPDGLACVRASGDRWEFGGALPVERGPAL